MEPLGVGSFSLIRVLQIKARCASIRDAVSLALSTGAGLDDLQDTFKFHSSKQKLVVSAQF